MCLVCFDSKHFYMLSPFPNSLSSCDGIPNTKGIKRGWEVMDDKNEIVHFLYPKLMKK